MIFCILHNTDLERLGTSCATLSKEIANQGTQKQELQGQQESLATALQAAQESQAAWRKTHEGECQQKDSEVSALKAEFARLQTGRLETEQKLRDQKKLTGKSSLHSY